MHINVYFKECVNGAIKKSDQFYPSLFVYHFECMRFIFLLEKKKKNKQSESITIGRF